MSGNDTTEITTREDKRPCKNLIKLNLPKPLQSNIDKCQQNLEDHTVQPEDNPEKDESLDVLERYKKSHYVKVHDCGEMKYTES